jgi:predicted phosphodiesterase
LTRILAVADEVSDALYGDALGRLRPEVIFSCGDLPFDYLENLVTRAGVPLVYVLGNHDPAVREWADEGMARLGLEHLSPGDEPGPQGCDSAEGKVVEVAGLRIAGLGGSVRYREGPNQYTQPEMWRRSVALELRTRLRAAVGRGGVDVLLTHAPPLGLGDAEDAAHHGFSAFHRLARRLQPRLLVHGHVHPVTGLEADREIGPTRVVNAIPYRLLEV